jgi:restriction system protein
MKSMWMIRAGRGSAFIDDFIEHSIVAIGWHRLGNIDPEMTREQLTAIALETWPDDNKSQISSAVGQVFRFLSEIQIGDRVVSYDSGRRKYHVGTIRSEAVYTETIIPEMPRHRDVNWDGEVDRDSLSVSTRNSLGAISTLFRLPDSAAHEIEKQLAGDSDASPGDPNVEISEQDQLTSIREQSRELIKDKINRLDPYELQDLVAGVLRAMGYKARVSPPGADRGVDILASPDGFGFEQPRIVVECKHRRDAMGSQEIRSFLGGRHKDDKGLYVSTGGFTKDARYEAERANIPVTLMDLDQLVDAVMGNYEGMDVEVKTLLPLVKLYWPA